MVRRLLRVIPEERISAEEALRHAYVAKFHNSAAERRLKAAVVPPLSDDVQVDIYNSRCYVRDGILLV